MRRNVLLILGAALALIGAGVTALYFSQPWRTCSYEDTATGCAMLDADAATLGGRLDDLLVEAKEGEVSRVR